MRSFRQSGHVLLIAIIVSMFLNLPGPAFGAPYTDVCTADNTWTPETAKNLGDNLEVTETICLDRGKSGTYNYKFVNIYSKDGKAEGKLIFKDANIDFWAKSILVEKGGSLIIGSPSNPIASAITIHLYGDEKDKDGGITCKSDPITCGVPSSPENNIWEQGKDKQKPLGNGVTDYFYQYKRLPTDADLDDKAYFGRKVLALSYGGTIQMFGRKGATFHEQLDPKTVDPSRVVSFSAPFKKGDSHFDLSRFIDWKKGSMVMFRDSSSSRYEIRTVRDIAKDPKDFHASLIIDEGLTSDIGQSGYIILIDPSGTSWARLDGSIKEGEKKLALDREAGWQAGDRIVVTTTDYLPGHSEELQIDRVDGKKITLKNAVKYPHNGEKYSLEKGGPIPDRLANKDFQLKEMENRAAVGLLTRSIRIVSEKCGSYDAASCNGMPEEVGTYFGGHTMVRQGFSQYQVQGVEFYQMGQGGRMSHSPVNFHLTRRVPGDSFVRDCSVNESMNRWIELRGTQKVLLERNIGWKSIGHGYLLADGPEADNVLRANLGVYARPAVGVYNEKGNALASFRDNPRRVPGILAQTGLFRSRPVNDEPYQFHSFCNPLANPLRNCGDYVHPSVFLIMNGYNTFEYNMAAGAGTCGSCYWVAPSNVSGPSMSQTWEGYANIQKKDANKATPGTAPIKSFRGNFCSTAMYSLLTIGGTGACNGVSTCALEVSDDTTLNEEIAKFVPIPNAFRYQEADYPDVLETSNLASARCKNGCLDEQQGQKFSNCIKGDTQDCVVNVIDSYTSSFHWADINFGAIWLRSNWFLMTDSILSDVLQGGLTMVSGGSVDQVINGYWALTRRSAFVGNTQKWDTSQDPPTGNPFASNAGPFNMYSGLQCDDVLSPKGNIHLSGGASVCLSRSEGIGVPTSNFGNYQRLYNIYDGPVYQEANAYLDIKKTPLNCSPDSPPGKCCTSVDKATKACTGQQYMFGGELNRGIGIPRAKEYPLKGKCFLPNAAIGWKQPNGFYYPPAFHSRNLFFNNVDLRHYIVVPLFKPGTLIPDVPQVKNEYCTYDDAGLFRSSFTDIDRQTELNDDDGSLAGLTGSTPGRISGGGTISVNRDKFFHGPGETMECLSEQSCFQVPYDYVSAVVYPDKVTRKSKDDNADTYCSRNPWCFQCDDQSCYGVPLYRQLLKSGEAASEEQSIRMMGTATFQRDSLVANNGVYYIDTLRSDKTQRKALETGVLVNKTNVFKNGQAYNVFLIYSKPQTRVTFQLYVGDGFDLNTDISLVRAGSEAAEDSDFDGKKNILLLTKLDSEQPMTFTRGNWPSKWIRDYKDGILTVIMDLSDPALAQDFLRSAKESCRPASFCSWKDENGGQCTYNKDQKIVAFQGDDSICEWSVKARECPSGGCPGFQFVFRGKDADYDQDKRPKTYAYTEVDRFYKGLRSDLKWNYDSDWAAPWNYADEKLSKDGNAGISEYSEKFTISDIDAAGKVITLSGGISNDQYTIVKKLDAAGNAIDWAWIDRTQKLAAGTRQLTLDRRVSWSRNDPVQASSATACVYKAANPVPPLPEDLWNKKQ